MRLTSSLLTAAPDPLDSDQPIQMALRNHKDRLRDKPEQELTQEDKEWTEKGYVNVFLKDFLSNQFGEDAVKSSGRYSFNVTYEGQLFHFRTTGTSMRLLKGNGQGAELFTVSGRDWINAAALLVLYMKHQNEFREME